ncbi:MAG: flagellin [Clostridiales bacterium]|nr:flagellin [Clostridiales bacterium]
MRIQHNIAALNAQRNLTGNNSLLSKNLEKLSSGYQINRAGDDAAGLAISEKMRAQITGLETAQKNANDGISMVQTAEGALTEVHSMLNRMVELATQSANGTYTDSNRAEMQKEIDALKNEIDRISSESNFNGQKLFTKDTKITLQVSETTSGSMAFTLQHMTSTSLTVNNLKVDNQTAANAAIATVNAAIDAVSGIRSSLGAIQNRLEHTINNLGVQTENITSAESRIRDVDMAKEMMEYTKNNILVQASQAMLAQANQIPQGVLQLLQ